MVISVRPVSRTTTSTVRLASATQLVAEIATRQPHAKQGTVRAMEGPRWHNGMQCLTPVSAMLVLTEITHEPANSARPL
jgi:hypothetical protein